MTMIIFNGRSEKNSKVAILLFGIVFGGLPSLIIVLPALSQNLLSLMTYIIGIISIIILIKFTKIMPKRTPYGNEMLGKIRGFKRFLEIAEKQELEALVNQNPEYFYNILPYTYALGVSDVWMQQFETIALQAPNWYVGYSTFNVHDFNNFMDTTMQNMQSASSKGGSGSSSSSGGGGSAGGGSGGGGRRFMVIEQIK